MESKTIRWELYPHVAATPHARAFIARLRQRSRQPKTIDAYARNLDTYLACFTGASVEQWIDADEGTILAYLDDLRSGRHVPGARSRRVPPENVVTLAGARVADATIAQHVVTLRQFYEYLIRTRIRADGVNPLPRGSVARRGSVRRRTRLPWIAPVDVWRQIVLHVVTKETVRNRAMILVAYDGALRREELVSVRVDDYDRHRALLKIRAETSKSGIDRWVPLSPFSQRVLNHYLDRHRQALGQAYDLEAQRSLFVSESTRNPGQSLAPGAFNDVIEALRAELDLPQLHPHTLRHQRLTALKAAGGPLEDIALFAGHASTETTRLYLHLAPTELRRKIREVTKEVDASLERLIIGAPDGP